MRKFLDVLGEGALSALFFVVLGLAVTAVLWNADFVFGDEELFLRTVCRGIPVPLQVIPSSGRCCPLSHWDCNFVLLLPRCLQHGLPQIIYGAKAIVLALTLYVFVRFLTLERPSNFIERFLSFLTAVAFVVAPAVLLVSCWNIFPEQRMLLLLAVFSFAAFRGLTGDSRRWYGLAGLAAAILLGYKETSFVLVGVFAGTVLLGGWRRLTRRGRAFCICLMMFAAGYCLAYGLLVYGKANASYQEAHKVGLRETMRFYVCQPELALAAALAVVRGLFFVCGRSGRHLLWDAMLFSGVAFVLAYVTLQLTSIYNYYQTPAYVFLLPVFLHWLLEASRRCRPAGALGVVLLLGLITYNAARTVPEILAHLDRRRTEMSVVRRLAANDDVERIYYYYPTEGLYEHYHRYLFGLYLEHVGGGVRPERITEMKDSLADDEVLVVPMSFINPDVPIMKAPSAVRTEWFTIVYGPVNGRRPRKCGRSGVVLRAGERGVDGLSVTGDGWGGQDRHGEAVPRASREGTVPLGRPVGGCPCDAEATGEQPDGDGRREDALSGEERLAAARERLYHPLFLHGRRRVHVVD